MKVCTKCQQDKGLHCFNKDKQKKDGYYSQCRKCARAKYDKYKAANVEGYKQLNNIATQKLRNKNVEKSNYLKQKSHLMKKFGITPEEREAILNSQNGCCAICGKHESLFKYKLAVEHCHQTKRIRGLACYYCNMRIIGRTNLKYAGPLVKYLVKAYPEIRDDVKLFLLTLVEKNVA